VKVCFLGIPHVGIHHHSLTCGRTHVVLHNKCSLSLYCCVLATIKWYVPINSSKLLDNNFHKNFLTTISCYRLTDETQSKVKLISSHFLQPESRMRLKRQVMRFPNTSGSSRSVTVHMWLLSRAKLAQTLPYSVPTTTMLHTSVSYIC
jgi:hypothetical protein